MANEEHLNLLMQGIADLNWADLSGADLSGAELAEANLFWADLSGANLSGAELAEANLFWANLSGTDLSGANLSKAKLSGTNLSGANLSGANLSGANLSGANLSGANLSGANLNEANLEKANLDTANLSEVYLNMAQLNEANLNGANLDKANLWDANLDGANLSKANLGRANLSRASLSGADLSGADLSGADFTSATLSEAKLMFATLSGANLSEANFCGANLSEANFRGANLNGANFCGANLSTASLEKTQVLATKFNNAILTGICVEDWNTNSATDLDDVICDYIYLRQFQQERRPVMGHFAPQEFTKLFQKALETIDLTFSESVDWQAFAYSLRDLQGENESAQIDIQSLEKRRNGVIAVRMAVSPNTDKVKIHSDFMQNYEFAHRLLEEQYQAESKATDASVASQTTQNVDYEGQINRLFHTIAQGEAVQKALARNSKIIPLYDLQETPTVRSYHIDRKIDGDYTQPALTEVAANIQRLLEKLSQIYPTSTDADKLTVVARASDEIKNNPRLKAQVINALQSGRTEALKRTVNHPLVSILVATLEETE